MIQYKIKEFHTKNETWFQVQVIYFWIFKSYLSGFYEDTVLTFKTKEDAQECIDEMTPIE